MKNLWKRNQIMISALALMIAIAGYLNFAGKKVDEEALFTTSAQFEEADATTANASDKNANDVAGLASAESADAITGDESMAMVSDVTQNDDLALITEDAGEYDALTDIDSMDSDEEMVYSDYLDEETAENVGQDNTALAESASVNTDSNQDSALNTPQDTAQATKDYNGEIPGEAVFTSGMTISSIESANLLKEQTREKNKEMLLQIINSDTISDSSKQNAIDSMIQLTDIAQKECSAQILLEAKGFEDVVVSISGDQADVIVSCKELSEAQRAQIEDIVSRKTGISAENIIISPVQ